MLVVLMCGVSSLFANESLNLADWIERALIENPDFQLMVRDYYLALEGLSYQEKLGVQNVSLSMNPVSKNLNGLEFDYLPAVNYSAHLPYKVNMSGGSGFKKDLDGKIQLSGNFNFSLNLEDILTSTTRDITSEIAYLEQENQLYSSKANLVMDVIQRYFQLSLCEYKVNLAQHKLELYRYQLDQAEHQYDAGIISEMVFYKVKDQVEDAQDSLNQIERDQKVAKRDFARLFGILEYNELFEQKLIFSYNSSDLDLVTENIDLFVQNWNSEHMEGYLQDNYSLQKGLLALQKVEENLAQIKKSTDWQVQMGLGLSYDTGQEEFVNVSGSVGLSKDLYNPSLKLDIEAAQIQLERQEIALAEMKSQLTYNLISQVEEVQILDERLRRGEKKLTESEERYERVVAQYQEGYLADVDILEAQIRIKEQIISNLEIRKQLILGKLSLGEMLCLDEFYK